MPQAYPNALISYHNTPIIIVSFNTTLSTHKQKTLTKPRKGAIGTSEAEDMQTRQPFGPTQMTPTTTQVIGSQYCKPSPTSLEIVRTANTFANEFRVYDHNSVFTLQSASFSVHKRCILLHQGNPIVTLRRKVWLWPFFYFFFSTTLTIYVSISFN